MSLSAPFAVKLLDYEIVLTSLLLFAGIFDVAFVRAEDTPANALLVLAKHDNTLAIVDPSSLQVLSRIPVGNVPHEVIASAAYVSNYGFGAYHTLAVVDLIAQKALPAIDLGAPRSAWIGFRWRQSMVHRRGSQGNWQL